MGFPIYSYRESCACIPCTSGDSLGLVRQAWSDGLGESSKSFNLYRNTKEMQEFG